MGQREPQQLRIAKRVFEAAWSSSNSTQEMGFGSIRLGFPDGFRLGRRFAVGVVDGSPGIVSASATGSAGGSNRVEQPGHVVLTCSNWSSCRFGSAIVNTSPVFDAHRRNALPSRIICSLIFNTRCVPHTARIIPPA